MPLNAALDSYMQAVKEIRDHTVRPKQAEEVRDRLKKTRHAIAELDERIEKRRAEHARLARLKAVKPSLAERAEVLAELDSLGDVPDLPSDAPEQRVKAQEKLATAERKEKAAEQRLEEASEKKRALVVPDRLLQRADEIHAVYQQIAVTRKAARDAQSRERELAAVKGRLASRLAEVHPGLDPGAAASLARPKRLRGRLADCLNRRSAVAERLQTALEYRRSAKDSLARTRSLLQAARVQADVGPLRAASRAARKAGPTEQQALEAEAEANRIEGEAMRRFAALTPRPPTVEALEELAFPSRERIERFAFEDKELDDKHASLAGERRNLERESARVKSEREQLTAEGEAPTAEALATARRGRDEDWQLIRQALVEGTPLAEPRAVTERHERLAAKADALADRRLLDAEKTARAEAVKARERELDDRQVELEGLEADLRRRQADLHDSWVAAWVGCGFEPPDPAVAASWYDACQQIVALLADSRRHSARAEAARELSGQHRSALASQMRETGVTTASSATLDELIELADAEVERLEAELAEHKRLEQTVQDKESALEVAERAVSDAESADQAWWEEWNHYRDANGLAEEIAPEDAPDVVAAIDEVASLSERVTELEREIDTAAGQRTDFERTVCDLCADVAPDLGDGDSEEAARRLAERLQAGERDKHTAEALEQRIAEARAERENACAEIDVARGMIEALLSAARCDTADELVSAERRSKRANELRSRRARLEAQIAETGEDRVERLAEEAGPIDGDTLSARLTSLATEIDELGAERDSERDTALGLSDQLQRLEHAVEAAQASQRAQLHAAQARALAERYAVAALSERLLRRTIERYRRKHQGPLLGRANELFPSLTRENFTELFVDYDEHDGQVIKGRRSDGKPLKVEQMSDGTREQLFLSLRLAAIERYVATSGPVPVIFDDVFLESDEPRSERILGAIAQLAEATQTLVFTHHRHLIELAEASVGSHRVAVQTLAPSAKLTTA